MKNIIKIGYFLPNQIKTAEDYSKFFVGIDSDVAKRHIDSLLSRDKEELKGCISCIPESATIEEIHEFNRLIRIIRKHERTGNRRIKADIYKGSSACRICGCSNGTSEWIIYQKHQQYVIPEGYSHYINCHKVKPDLDNLRKAVILLDNK